MKYIQGLIHLRVAGVYVSNVPSKINGSLVHNVGVHYVRVQRNGMVLRYSGHDDVRRRPNHDLS